VYAILIDGSFTFIEYNITGSTQKKRAYVASSALTGTGSKIIKDPITKSSNFTKTDHYDYPVAIGTAVYAMCDGTFHFSYYWDTKNGSKAYVSLGRGTKLIPDSGWQTADGRKPVYMEYGHLSNLNGYTTPTLTENTYPSSWTSTTQEIVLADKKVTCGDLIGYSGNSGNANGVHFHVQLMY
jgi:murein DD-endopeptidase MepM/ murein hydrolase activator NlpD